MRTSLPILALVLAVIFLPDACEARDDTRRLTRRAALIGELLEEGATGEAADEARTLVAESPSATNALAFAKAELALCRGSAEGAAEAFLTARDPRVFHVAGALLSLHFQCDSAFREGNANLAEQVELCRGSWSERDWAEARTLFARIRPPQPPHGPGAWLAAGVVGFYRIFVGPALGSRCVLEPSCSRYYLEASRKHGVLGVPMIADRFVREPVESHSGRRIRMPNGSWRHPDPVSDHDGWFAKEVK